MIYPVNAHDLANNIANDDEHATLIVVESIVSETFETLDFVDSINPHDIYTRVTTWESFPDYTAIISSQKTLLTSCLPAQHNEHPDLNEADISTSNDITARVISQREEQNSSQKKYKVLAFSAVAASLLIVATGLFAVTNSQDSSDTSSKTQALVSTTSENSTSDVAGAPPHVESDENAKKSTESTAEVPTTALPITEQQISGHSPVAGSLIPRTNVESESNTVNTLSSSEDESGPNLLITGVFVLGAVVFVAFLFAVWRKIKSARNQSH